MKKKNLFSLPSIVLLIACLVAGVVGGNLPLRSAGAAPEAVQVTLADGSLSHPALTFESDKDTGLYRSASGTSVLVSNGAAKLTVGSGITAAGAVAANAGLTMGTDSLFALDGGTATATAGAATLNKQSGTITSESLTTAAAAAYTLTLTNSVVAATSRVVVSVDNGTNSAGIPVFSTATPSSGQVIIKVYNLHASAAFNGTLKIRFAVL